MKKIHFIILFISIVFFKGNAQGITFFGNTNIDSGGVIYVKNLPVILEGKVHTSGSVSPGMLAFSENSDWQRENEGVFVDGTVKSYHTSEFEFPIGNADLYAPIRVFSDGEVTGRYLFESAGSTNELSEDLDAVSTLEHWNINSSAEGVLTLTWRLESNLDTFTGNDLENLRIAGWNSALLQWDAIPCQILTGDINTGSLVSQGNVDFSVYSAFTFGMKDSHLGIDSFGLPNISLFIKGGILEANSTNSMMLRLSFFDMSGRLLSNYRNINAMHLSDAFPYPKGIYIAKITLGEGQVVNQKVLNQ